MRMELQADGLAGEPGASREAEAMGVQPRAGGWGVAGDGGDVHEVESQCLDEQLNVERRGGRGQEGKGVPISDSGPKANRGHERKRSRSGWKRVGEEDGPTSRRSKANLSIVLKAISQLDSG